MNCYSLEEQDWALPCYVWIWVSHGRQWFQTRLHWCLHCVLTIKSRKLKIQRDYSRFQIQHPPPNKNTIVSHANCKLLPHNLYLSVFYILFFNLYFVFYILYSIFYILHSIFYSVFYILFRNLYSAFYILFYILFYHLYSFLYSIFYILFYVTLFYSLSLCTILLYFTHFYSTLVYSDLIYSLFYSILFCCTLERGEQGCWVEQVFCG